MPTSEPGRTDEGEARYGSVSGTSVSAAVAAGGAAILAQARPQAGAASLLGLLVGSARKVTDEEQPTAAMLDLHAAAQQEIAVEPAVLSFRSFAGGPLVLEQTVRLHNLGSPKAARDHSRRHLRSTASR